MQTRLDRLRGVRTQSDTDAEIRDQKRFGSGLDALKAILNNPVLKGKLTIRKTSDDALVVVNDEDETQVLIGTQTAGSLSNPIFLIGANIVDIFTYGLKIFGNKGDVVAPLGFHYTATENFARWESGAHHEPGGTTLTTVGSAAWTAGGTIVNDDSSTGSWALYTTAASIGDAQGPNGPLLYRTDQGIEALFRVKMGGDITSQRVWIGLFDGNPSASSTPALNFAGFRYVAGTDTTWRAYTGDGANRTNEDTTIVVAADQTYYLRLRLTSTEAQMIIGLPGINDSFTNGTFTTAITTTLPTMTTRMSPYIRITALAASARSLRFGFFRALSR